MLKEKDLFQARKKPHTHTKGKVFTMFEFLSMTITKKEPNGDTYIINNLSN